MYHIYLSTHLLKVFLKCLSDKESACQCRRHGLDPWVRKIPWRMKWQHTLDILAWRIPMDRGAWWATIQGVTNGSDVT